MKELSGSQTGRSTKPPLPKIRVTPLRPCITSRPSPPVSPDKDIEPERNSFLCNTNSPTKVRASRDHARLANNCVKKPLPPLTSATLFGEMNTVLKLLTKELKLPLESTQLAKQLHDLHKPQSDKYQTPKKTLTRTLTSSYPCSPLSQLDPTKGLAKGSKPNHQRALFTQSARKRLEFAGSTVIQRIMQGILGVKE